MGLVITRVRRRHRRAAVRVLSSSSSRCSGSTSKRGFDNYNAGNLYYLCAAVRCYAGPYAARVLRRRPVHLAAAAVTAGGAPPFLSPLPSLLRLKIGGSFDGRTLWTAPPPSPPSRAVRRARRCTQPAKRPQRPPQKSTQARQSPLWSQPKEPLIGLCCYILCTNYTVVLLLPATDEIRPTTATQPTAKSS